MPVPIDPQVVVRVPWDRVLRYTVRPLPRNVGVCERGHQHAMERDDGVVGYVQFSWAGNHFHLPHTVVRYQGGARAQ